VDEAVERALAQAEDGADIIDFGGESTRPGAAYVDEAQELRRVIPVIEAFRKQSAVAVSVDTRKAAVAEQSLAAGADIINDISALEDDPRIAGICARAGAGLILMHKRGVPASMQDAPLYEDVVREVADYLAQAARRAITGGVAADKIILDPGIGFGKRTQDNLDLIAHLDVLCALGYPVLMALSRKTFLGTITAGVPPGAVEPAVKEVMQVPMPLASEPAASASASATTEPPHPLHTTTDSTACRCNRPGAAGRLAATITANTVAVLNGARIVRVHDIREAVDMVKTLYALRRPTCRR
jgi:dihydropteroate synthase